MFEKLCQLRCGQRVSQVVTLTVMASELDQASHLTLGFDAFGDNIEGQPQPEPKDGLDERRGALVGFDLVNKELVDLDHIYRETAQITQ